MAIIGKPETASSRLNLSQGFNSLGTTIAPLLGGFLIFTYFSDSAQAAGAVKVPYIIFSLVFLCLAVIFRFIHLPEFKSAEAGVHHAGALHYRHLVLGIVAIFLYVGAEVSIGSMMISFIGLKEIAGLKPAEASVFVAFYWGGLMIGRFIGAISLSKMRNERKQLLMWIIPLLVFLFIWYQKGLTVSAVYTSFILLSIIGFYLGKFLPARTLFVFSVIIDILIVTALLSSGAGAMWCIIAVGLFNSIMWSNIFTLAIDGLGANTSQGSSLLVMAILGGALLPVLQGFAADNLGVHTSFIVPFFAYIYLAYYGLKGYKIKHSEAADA